MAKDAKLFRKQAAKAERVARSISDAEVSQNLINLAEAYRRQADALKKSKKKKPDKKRR
jgi:hypothetical protein